MSANCHLLGQADGIRRRGSEQGQLSAWRAQSTRRKCLTQLGAGPQVSVKHSTEAEEPGAGRLQQKVTFEADPREFPPSAGPLFLPVGASSSVLAEQPVSPRVVTVLLLGLVKEEESLSLPSLAIARGAERPCGLRLLSRSKAQPSALAGDSWKCCSRFRLDFLWKNGLGVFAMCQVWMRGTLRVPHLPTQFMSLGGTAFQAQSWDLQTLGPSFLESSACVLSEAYSPSVLQGPATGCSVSFVSLPPSFFLQ